MQSQQRLLDDVFGVADARHHAIRDREQQRAQILLEPYGDTVPARMRPTAGAPSSRRQAELAQPVERVLDAPGRIDAPVGDPEEIDLGESAKRRRVAA